MNNKEIIIYTKNMDQNMYIHVKYNMNGKIRYCSYTVKASLTIYLQRKTEAVVACNLEDLTPSWIS